MDAANLLPYEKVTIVDNNNGARFETYISTGKNSLSPVAADVLNMPIRVVRS